MGSVQLVKATSDVDSSSMTIHINMSQVHSENDFFCVASKSLGFPDYFGNNWDAFEECLSEIDSRMSNTSIVIENSSERHDRIISLFCDIWESASKYWTDDSDIKAYIVRPE